MKMNPQSKMLWKVAGATGLFALVHSALASRKAKEVAASVLGERNRNAFYRPFFNTQAVVTSGALAYYIYRQPDQKLYHVQGWPAWLMQAVRLAFLGYGVAAARQIGLSRLLGWPGLKARLSGQNLVPPEPEAQGPAPGLTEELNAEGPFQTSRHPLNFIGIPILWLSPTMTLKLVLFNTLATSYFWLGSYHEARRLRQAYGEAYRNYEKSGVPFFWPGRKRQKSVSRRGAAALQKH